MRTCAVLLAAALWARVAVAKVAPPRNAEVERLLKQALKAPVLQTEVLADVGGGRFPVLFATRGAPTKADENVNDEGYGPHCGATNVPHVAIVTRAAAGAPALEAAIVDLPTTATACEGQSPLQWGVTRLKDYDLDGRPELLIVYGYFGANHSEVGSERYKELSIVELAPLALALHVELSDLGCASVAEQMKSEFKLVPRADTQGAPDDLVVTRTTAELSPHGCDLDDWATVEVTTEVTTWRHDVKHKWLPAKTEKKVKRPRP